MVFMFYLKKKYKMQLYKYKNYDEYKKIQEEGNIQKIKCCWVLENNIKILSNYLTKYIEDIKFGICHGTRRGKEQEWFKNILT